MTILAFVAMQMMYWMYSRSRCRLQQGHASGHQPHCGSLPSRHQRRSSARHWARSAMALSRSFLANASAASRPAFCSGAMCTRTAGNNGSQGDRTMKSCEISVKLEILPPAPISRLGSSNAGESPGPGVDPGQEQRSESMRPALRPATSPTYREGGFRVFRRCGVPLDRPRVLPRRTFRKRGSVLDGRQLIDHRGQFGERDAVLLLECRVQFDRRMAGGERVLQRVDFADAMDRAGQFPDLLPGIFAIAERRW
jgi:hypothetical protein